MNLTTTPLRNRWLFPAVVFLIFCQTFAYSQAFIQQAPKDQRLSEDFNITINGQNLPVYPVLSQHHDKKYSAAYFEFKGPVTIKVKSKTALTNLTVLPARLGIKPQINGNEAEFIVDKPFKLSFEPSGQNSPLLLFGDSIENDVPKRKAPGLIYYGPGIHNPTGGLIKLTSGQTLYLAAGAVVKAGIDASGKDITIKGRGILDGSDWVHNAGPNDFFINATDCTNLVIKDVILKGSYYWTIVPQRCQGVLIDNVKLLGSRVGNDDGVDPCNSTNVVIRNCFFRTDDDSISPKGTTRADGEKTSLPCENILVENCTFWVDFANVFRIATESSCPGVRNFTARNIDVIHFPDRANVQIFYLHPTGQMPMENLTFEDIRINGEHKLNLIKFTPMQPLVGTRPIETPKPNNIKTGPGRRGIGSRGYGEFVTIPAAGPFIHNVIIRNVEIYGTPQPFGNVLIKGWSATQDVAAIRLDNIVWYGKKLQRDWSNVEIGNFTNMIEFK